MENRTITEDDTYLFAEGTHQRLQDVLGAHPIESGGVTFRVWAPSSPYVTLVGSFNDWHEESHSMTRLPDCGVWEIHVPEAKVGDLYKFCVHTPYGGFRLHKADPFARAAQLPPDTASIVAESRHPWNDGEWMKRRAASDFSSKPISIYELHLGSWRRAASAPERLLGYRELAPLLLQIPPARLFDERDDVFELRRS